MADKVDKIRQEVEKLMYGFNLEADIASCEDAEAEKLANIKYQLCKKILEYIDSIQDEPISENLEEAMQHNAPDNIGIDDLLYWRNGFITGAKLVSERSSAYIDMLAKWRKAQFEKN